MSSFVHMELNTSDVDGAKAFYQGVFGWKYQTVEMADGSTYTMVAGPDGGIGGIQQNPAPGAPPHWLGYVGVASVKRTIAKVKKRGGTVMMGPIDIPGMGSMAIFTDPQGVAFAVWQAAAGAPANATAQEAPKASTKKASKKKAAKKAPAKKASKKKAAKKAPAKKASKKKTAKKK